MLQNSKKTNVKALVHAEKKLVNEYIIYEKDIKNSLSSYIAEFKELQIDNEYIKTMFLNNLTSSLEQIDSIVEGIDSLNDALDLLEKQFKLSAKDINTYNALVLKTNNDIELLQSLLYQTITNFENIASKEDIKISANLNKYKNDILKPCSFLDITYSSSSSQKTKSEFDFIKKNVDVYASDLLCFFPKKETDSLVISTVQENYKISFKNEVASIHIKDESFNLSLKTSGVQISNSSNGDILYIAKIKSNYKIITNEKLELSPITKVSKVSKSDDFIEIEISNSEVNLVAESGIINFTDESFDSSILSHTSTSLSENNDNIVEETIEPEVQITKELDKVEQKKTSSNAKAKAETIIENSPAENNNNSDANNNSDQNNDDISSEDKKVVKQDDDIAETSIIDSTYTLSDNDTLIISDSNKKVILPYKLDDIKEKLKSSNKYSSLEEIIEKEYVVPMETYKNPIKSRFREAFQLIKKKEKGSLKEAIELGFELMFQSDLNPAIISACKDLDELDIYLDCLDDNELDKFSCFKIKYDLPLKK